jgi:hypothetical protein
MKRHRELTKRCMAVRNATQASQNAISKFERKNATHSLSQSSKRILKKRHRECTKRHEDFERRQEGYKKRYKHFTEHRTSSVKRHTQALQKS